MLRISFVTLCSVLVLAFGARPLSASTITYAVGNCRPSLPRFATILAALAAVPSANVVEVAPAPITSSLRLRTQ